MAYATDHKADHTVYGELLVLSRQLAASADLKSAIANPVVPADEKLALMCAATAGQGSVSPELTRFFRLVLQEGREPLLQFIVLSFLDMYRAKEKIGVGHLITAVPVDAETEKRLTGNASRALDVRMELTTEVDASIEGGFIFDYNGLRLDASVATQLRRLKQQLIEKNRRIV